MHGRHGLPTSPPRERATAGRRGGEAEGQVRAHLTRTLPHLARPPLLCLTPLFPPMAFDRIRVPFLAVPIPGVHPPRAVSLRNCLPADACCDAVWLLGAELPGGSLRSGNLAGLRLLAPSERIFVCARVKMEVLCYSDQTKRLLSVSLAILIRAVLLRVD